MNIDYVIAKVFRKILGKEVLSVFFRFKGVKIGKACNVCSNIDSSEPYLIEIGNNVTISTNVKFITHDSSIGVFLGKKNYSDLCGSITIGDDVFIGMNTVLLYGIKISDKTIIAAGSVVTKSFPSNVIIGGNPAKILGTVDDFLIKYKNNYLRLHNFSSINKKRTILNNKQKFVSRNFPYKHNEYNHIEK